MNFIRVNVDGSTETFPLPECPDARYQALRDALGGSIAYYPEAYHGLIQHEVVHLDDWYGELDNPTAAHMCGIAHELCGPVLIVPLPEGQDTHAERAHQQGFFGAMAAAIAQAGQDDDVIVVVEWPAA